MQKNLANWTANLLSEKLGTEVTIGSINIGFLNHIIIDDLDIKDLNGKDMLHSSRMSASIDYLSLIKGKIDIPTAQLFGTNAQLYKEDGSTPANFQFLIDALKSDNEDKDSKINLRINSIIVRHANISYDLLSTSKKEQQIDPDHLKVKDAGFNLALRNLTNDSLSIAIKRFSATEANSGLRIKELAFLFEANKEQGKLRNFQIQLPESYLKIDSCTVTYNDYDKDGSFSFSKTKVYGIIVPSELACIFSKDSPAAESLTQKSSAVNFDLSIQGSDKDLKMPRFALWDKDNSLQILMDAEAHNYQTASRILNANINYVRIKENYMKDILSLLNVNEDMSTTLLNFGDINLQTKINHNKNNTDAEGTIKTSRGSIKFDGSLDANKNLIANISSSKLDIAGITGNENFGNADFDVKLDLDLHTPESTPEGSIDGKVNSFDYNNYTYKDAQLQLSLTSDKSMGNIDIRDANITVKGNGGVEFSDKFSNIKSVAFDMEVEKFNPHALNLTESYPGENYSLSIKTDLKGTDIDNLRGFIGIDNFNVSTPSEQFHINTINILSEYTPEGNNQYSISSDFINGNIIGKVRLTDIPASITNILAEHLPRFIGNAKSTSPATNYSFDFTLNDSPFTHHFINDELEIRQTLAIKGTVNAQDKQLAMNVNAPKIIYNGTQYDHIDLLCNNTSSQLNIKGTGIVRGEEASSKIIIDAQARNNLISSNIKFKNDGKHSFYASLNSSTLFTDSLGHLKTTINLKPSDLVINDTAWNVTPASVSVYKKEIECSNIKISNGLSHLKVDGRISTNPSDSIIADLRNLELEYILNLVNFHSVEFGGRVSGIAQINNIYGTPDIDANLHVEDFSLQGGRLGTADINARWDKNINGVNLLAHIVDNYKRTTIRPDSVVNQLGITNVNGWVSPANDDINLRIETDHTNAEFLQGFLGGVFRNIDGCITGPLNLIGPMDQINLVGDANVDINMTLRATNVPYHLVNEKLILLRDNFLFRDMTIRDEHGNAGVINGTVSHHNFKNFRYSFDMDMNQLLVYDEKEFNSDKFYSTLFANGSFSLAGSDGHPLYMEANITPTKGSVFAYDAASPDALTNSTFIEFHSIAPEVIEDITAANMQTEVTTPTAPTTSSLYDINNLMPFTEDYATYNTSREVSDNEYEGEIHIDFNINMNPNCEVKLRMDNTEDGYISTFGYGSLHAQYYNKGAFQLFGNYNINRGSYRLFLQDIIYRDLAIQDGSSVEFNGNPFDANIHLICHHTLNAVPLSDLVSTASLTQNNKVKVICILDITGTLDHMDFTFNLSLPNVNDEIRQIVRSLISSEEEMNTQMIYLLGVGRFFPNELARANGEDNSSQAVSSLVSSTISGQINQMLSSIIGNNSNWNFGTGISTGEKGWEDLDVEGILSGRLLNERLLINGNFGYRDNAMTNQANFIGDFEVKWRVLENSGLYLKAYNMANDRYFTKASLNTQGIGINLQHDFESWRSLSKKNRKENNDEDKNKTINVSSQAAMQSDSTTTY